MPSCLILGGGLGSRLGSLTGKIPKPLVEVNGEPFIRHQLRWLASQGIADIVYSTGHLGHLIRQELDHRPVPGCSIRFVDDGPELRGTGGAVRLAVAERSVNDPFLVLYGDSYLDIEVGYVMAGFDRSGCDALMTVFVDPERTVVENARVVGDRVVLYDKTIDDPTGAGMRHVDYGLSVLTHRVVLDLIPDDGPSDLADMFNQLSLAGELAAFAAEHRFHEVGTPAGIEALELHLTEQQR